MHVVYSETQRVVQIYEACEDPSAKCHDLTNLDNFCVMENARLSGRTGLSQLVRSHANNRLDHRKEGIRGISLTIIPGNFPCSQRCHKIIVFLKTGSSSNVQHAPSGRVWGSFQNAFPKTGSAKILRYSEEMHKNIEQEVSEAIRIYYSDYSQVWI